MAGITKELRAWAEEFPLHGGPLACVLACADRIDERHEDELGAARANAEAEYDGWYPPCEVDGMRRFAERLEAAAAERADVTLFGVDYTPLELVKEHLANRCMTLPLDADGEPWHINDEFEVDEGIAHVNGIGDNRLYYIDNDGMQWTRADNKRHHHAQTVEGVLREFGAGWYERMRGPETFDIADYVEHYAAKLRLANDND